MFSRALLVTLALALPAAAEATRCPSELPVLFVVQDKSGTMAERPDPACPGCPSKWSSSKAAVARLSQKFADRFRFGVQMFPRDPVTFSCTLGTTVTPFPASTADITAAYAAAAPGGGTPTAGTLDAASAYLAARNLAEPAYVLLLTDGLPNCNLGLDPATCAPSQPACANGACGAKGCLDDAGARAAAARVRAAGYKVYVVGFDAAVATHVNRAVLDAVAAAGGTGQAYTATDTASLDAALEAIAFDATTCCKDVCASGEARCTASGEVQQCSIDEVSGCTNWFTSDCPPRSSCAGGVCHSCQDGCTLDATRCLDGAAQRCTVGPSGCTEWTTLESCGFEEVCAAGSCTSCLACSAGARRCAGSDAELCEQNPTTGCTSWKRSACAAGSTCQAGQCQSCSLTCQPGAARCSGKVPELCVADAQGCTSWQPGAACSDFCSGGACGLCGTHCTPGEARCNGNSIESCAADAHGCSAWVSHGACLAGQRCAEGACQGCPIKCTPGARRCAAEGVEECRPGADGCNGWVLASACAAEEACRDGACVPPCEDECLPGALGCDARGGPQRCELAPSGCAVWRPRAPCLTGEVCVEGSCREPCLGGEIETCLEGLVCTGLPEGERVCLPDEGEPEVDPGQTPPPKLEEPEADPGTAPQPPSSLAEVPAGCGCAAAPAAPLWLALALWPLALAGRRRRRG